MLDWFGRKLREMQEVKRDERGFTLIELLVVVIIIGILAAIAIPVFLGQRDNARDAAAQSSARNALSAAATFYTEDESYAGMVATDLEAIEPSLDYAATPTANNPNNVGFTVNGTGDQVTIGVGSASGDSFWVRRDDTGTTYGVTENGITAPTTFTANGW